LIISQNSIRFDHIISQNSNIDERWNDGRLAIDDLTMNDERWTIGDGRYTISDGRWTMDDWRYL